MLLKPSVDFLQYRGDPLVYNTLHQLYIPFDYYEHPPVPTVEEAALYWKDIEAAHCKNLFFRNHKGNQHYLVILDYRNKLNIRQLELLLRQGKLTFASAERTRKYLGLEHGSVSPFGLLYDTQNHTIVFIDEYLFSFEKISFHPNLNTASLVIASIDFKRYLNYCGNVYHLMSFLHQN